MEDYKQPTLYNPWLCDAECHRFILLGVDNTSNIIPIGTLCNCGQMIQTYEGIKPYNNMDK